VVVGNVHILDGGGHYTTRHSITQKERQHTTHSTH